MQARLTTWSRRSGFRRQSKRARSMASAGQNTRYEERGGATRDVARQTAGEDAGVSEWSGCGAGWRSISEVLCLCLLLPASCLGWRAGSEAHHHHSALAFLISSRQRHLHNVSTSFNALFTRRQILCFWPHQRIPRGICSMRTCERHR